MKTLKPQSCLCTEADHSCYASYYCSKKKKKKKERATLDALCVHCYIYKMYIFVHGIVSCLCAFPCRNFELLSLRQRIPRLDFSSRNDMHLWRQSGGGLRGYRSHCEAGNGETQRGCQVSGRGDRLALLTSCRPLKHADVRKVVERGTV